MSAPDDVTYAGEDLEILCSLERYQSWIVSTFAPYVTGRLVEIGAGMGSFSRRLIPMAHSMDIIEPSPNLHAHLESLLADHGNVTILGQTAEQWVETGEECSRDTIVMINVLEHIEDDAHVLTEMHRILTPGGHLLVFVPAMMALYSKLDEFYGHHRRYGRASLEAKVREAGFEVVESRYMDVLGVLPWLVLNKWMGRTDFDARLVRLYDRIGVPLTRTIERLARFPFGKNVMVVARRRHD